MVMFVHTALAVQLVVLAVAGPIAPTYKGSLLPGQKSVATQRLVESATDCIARAVAKASDSHRPVSEQLGELITGAMPGCADRMRAMIESYDDSYGAGSGEAFFVGPYLDALPTAVGQRLQRKATAE
jgi:hypothetical protein